MIKCNLGTVSVWSSAAEMGTGRSTKAARAVAITLEIDMNSIVMQETHTGVIPVSGWNGYFITVLMLFILTS